MVSTPQVAPCFVGESEVTNENTDGFVSGCKGKWYARPRVWLRKGDRIRE